MFDLVFGWNLWLVAPLGYLLYRINFSYKRNTVKVKSHTRTRLQTDERYERFKRHHMAGLKAMNPTKFARRKRLERLTNNMNKLQEKAEHYYRLGEFKKAEHAGNKVANLDDEINKIEL